MHGTTVVLLTLHAGAAAGSLLFFPRGFPLNNIHAWSDLWIPIAVALVLGASLVQFVFFRSSAFVVSLGLAAVAGGWLAASVSGLVLFPISIGIERAIGPLAIAIALLAFAWLAKFRVVPSLVAALAGAAVGYVEIQAQEAPPPSTRPAGGSLAEVHGDPSKEEAATGQVSFPCGKEHVRVRPLLTFESRSPDKTWTVLAPPDAFGPHRKLDAFAKDKNGFRAHYTDDGESTVVATKDLKGLDIEGMSQLPRPVYSHLNAFTTIHIPFDAAISFGPTEREKFDLEPADYPTGRPMKLAYLGPDIVFHVVRASDAEKGPFTELAKGHLGRDEPLVIEIQHKAGASLGSCKLTFKDWSSQLSTEASPSAGWGVPQNSIQFSSRQLADGRTEGMIVMTLAETGPGRGWHSVAHSEGIYKNRVRVDTVMTEPPPSPPKK